jgi:hypothetical protein
LLRGFSRYSDHSTEGRGTTAGFEKDGDRGREQANSTPRAPLGVAGGIRAALTRRVGAEGQYKSPITALSRRSKPLRSVGSTCGYRALIRSKTCPITQSSRTTSMIRRGRLLWYTGDGNWGIVIWLRMQEREAPQPIAAVQCWATRRTEMSLSASRSRLPRRDCGVGHRDLLVFNYPALHPRSRRRRFVWDGETHGSGIWGAKAALQPWSQLQLRYVVQYWPLTAASDES